MKKILFVIARLNVGGTSQYLRELIDGLEKVGYEVIVAVGNVQGAEVEDSAIVSMPVYRIPNLGRRISLISDMQALFEIRKLIREFKPDLIYSHTFKAGLLVRLFPSKCTVIHCFHGHLLTDPEFNAWKIKLVIYVERFLENRTRFLVTVGKRVAKELIEVGIGSKEKYRPIAPGVRKLKLESRDIARRELGLDSEVRPIVVWLARVTAVKAPQRVAEIARKIPEARFVLAGGGDLLDEIQKNCPSNLSIVGWQPASRMWAIADLAISTSENEGMPVALIEAQLAGLPVVAVDVGSVGEVISDGETGFVFKSFGPEYIEKVRELVLSAESREKIGARAAVRASHEFSIEKMVNTHIALFKEACGE